LGFITKGLSGGNSNGGGQSNGGLGGQIGGGLNGGLNGGGANGGSNGGFGFGSNGNSNGGAQGGSKGNGGLGFGFGSNGGAQAGGKGNGNAGGIFGFGGGKGNGKGNGQSNGNIGGGASASGGSGLLSSVISGIRGILGQYFSIATGLIGGSKSWAETVQSLVQTGFSNFFKVFGGLALSQQSGIGNLFAKSLEVFTTVMKLKMGAAESIGTLLQTEIKVVKAVLEKEFSNMAGIFKSLGAAPQISGSVSVGFKMAKKEYNEQYNHLDAGAKKGLSQMMGSLKDAQQKVGKVIGSATKQQKSELGVLYNVIKNLHTMTLAIA